MKTDLDEETETPPAPDLDPDHNIDNDTGADEDTIIWRPGMCVTPDCGHLLAHDEDAFCPPCQILFGSYAELIAHDDVQEWAPPAEPEAVTPPEPASQDNRGSAPDPGRALDDEAHSDPPQAAAGPAAGRGPI